MNAPAPTVQYLEVTTEQQDQRIDNYLSSRLKGVPKGRIYRILRKGEVRVNRKRVKPTYRLQAGDQVRIPPLRLDSPPPPEIDNSNFSWLERAILYEDPWLLALDKPAGMAVHGGSGIRYGVIEGLRATRPEATGYELVHRLDRATSGILLVAKRRSALRALHEALRNHQVEKEYLALVAGKVGKRRVVTAPLRKQILRSGERIVRVDPTGKVAESHFQPERHLPGATLTRVRIITGRTHQIRVHASHIGHPIAGDERYGEETFNRTMKALGLRRLFLHAHRIRFPHPHERQPMELEIPLPPPLQLLLEQLERAPHAPH